MRCNLVLTVPDFRVTRKLVVMFRAIVGFKHMMRSGSVSLTKDYLDEYHREATHQNWDTELLRTEVTDTRLWR